jgi:integrase
MPKGFVLMKESLAISTKMVYLRTINRDNFTDKRLTPHSGRHTFIEMSRRAGCDALVIDEITGHGKKNVSSTYGSYPDEVLSREIEKVWKFTQKILKNK